MVIMGVKFCNFGLLSQNFGLTKCYYVPKDTFFVKYVMKVFIIRTYLNI